jgi:plasmid maintenance system antidote protein VapI
MSPQFDWRDLVTTATDHAKATEHRPMERAVLLREIMRLKAQGLRIRDVAEALGLNPSAIESLIEGDGSGSGNA